MKLSLLYRTGQLRRRPQPLGCSFGREPAVESQAATRMGINAIQLPEQGGDDFCRIPSRILQAGTMWTRSYATFKGDLSIVYIGPDALMPIASVFAAVAGFVMMFWRRLVGALRMLVQKMTGRSSPQP